MPPLYHIRQKYGIVGRCNNIDSMNVEQALSPTCICFCLDDVRTLSRHRKTRRSLFDTGFSYPCYFLPSSNGCFQHTSLRDQDFEGHSSEVLICLGKLIYSAESAEHDKVESDKLTLSSVSHSSAAV